MWNYANVKYSGSLKNHWRRDALAQRFLHDTKKRNKLCGRQNASAETRKNQILQGAGQVAKKNCDAEVDIESGPRKPDCGRAEKQLSIVICECRLSPALRRSTNTPVATTRIVKNVIPSHK